MNTTTNTTNASPAKPQPACRRTLGILLAIAVCALFTTTGSVLAKGPFSKIVSFGDSLSDVGNFFGATGMPPFPYYEGRVSNGPVWLEHLAVKLRTPLNRGDQYAWLGSTSGNTNFRDIPEAGIFFPGFEQQIDAFIATTGAGNADPDALYTVWIGANDILAWLVAQDKTPEDLVMTGVANTVQGIVDLAGQGARHFVVGNLPNLGITPSTQELGPGIAALLTELSFTYNFVLEAQLAQLEDNLDIFITRLDAFAIINEIAQDPEFFGLSNVTDQALASFPTSDPDEFLFWDSVHPTTVGHEWTANFVCLELLKTYAPPRSRGKGPRSIRALNGLVRAAIRREASDRPRHRRASVSSNRSSHQRH